MMLLMIDMIEYAGRLHPLLVHLPIGLITGAVLFDVWRRLRPVKDRDDALIFIWVLAAISAIFSGLTGYVRANGDGYAEELLSAHRLGGILLAIVTSIVALLHLFGRMLFRYRILQPVLSTGTFALLIYTGHGGGSLTHGADYLGFSATSKDETTKMVRRTSIDSVELFSEAVMPILQTRCAGCHNATKQKGGLLLLDHASILKGGKTGPGIVPGDPTASELFRRVSLPSDHKEFMPTEGRTPLTAHQRDILEWWIAKGAAASMPMTSNPPDARMREVLESYFQIHRDAMLDIEADPVSESVVEDLREAGYRVNHITATGTWLEIKYEDSTRPDLDLLRKVADQLVWLQLADCGLKDEDMNSIAKLTNLARLNLSKNNISDAGVAKLQELNQLEYLNLYNTRISKSSLDLFSTGFPKLKKIYVGDTGVDTIPSGTRNGLDIIYRLD
jgi:uncharacterized membrane protein